MTPDITMIKLLKDCWNNWGVFAVHLFLLMFVAAGLAVVFFNVIGIHNADAIIIKSAIWLYLVLLVLRFILP